jgi:hypothetical protein
MAAPNPNPNPFAQPAIVHYPPAYITQPLQPPYNFSPSGFYDLSQHVAGMPAANTSPYQVAPIIATYASQAQRNQIISTASPADQEQYKAGRAVNSATRYYPSTQGGVGLVASSFNNAVQGLASNASNEWHTVGVLRQGPTVWVYDPSYTPSSQTRLPMVPGTANVTRLLNSPGFGQVTQVQIYGGGISSPECMGRAAQWVDNVIGAPTAPAPFPAGTFVPGHVGPGWEVISRN